MTTADRLLEIICLIAEEPQGDPHDELNNIRALIADHWGMTETEEEANRLKALRNSLENDLNEGNWR